MHTAGPYPQLAHAPRFCWPRQRYETMGIGFCSVASAFGLRSPFICALSLLECEPHKGSLIPRHKLNALKHAEKKIPILVFLRVGGDCILPYIFHDWPSTE